MSVTQGNKKLKVIKTIQLTTTYNLVEQIMKLIRHPETKSNIDHNLTNFYKDERKLSS